jgi:hypothetical protein
LPPITTVHDEIAIECDANVAQGTAHWFSTTLPSAVEAVRGRPELAGEEVVETSVVSSWRET